MHDAVSLKPRRTGNAALAAVAAAVLLSSLFVATPAMAESRSDLGFTFEIVPGYTDETTNEPVNDYAVVTSYSGSSTHLVIPDNFSKFGDDENLNAETGEPEGGWWDVRGIAGNIFVDNTTEIVSVHVPHSVATIAANAFNSMDSITSVYLRGAPPLLELNDENAYPLGAADAVTVYSGPTGEPYPLDENGRWFGYAVQKSTVVSVDDTRRVTFGIDAGERTMTLGEIGFGGTPFSHTERTLTNISDDGVNLVVDDSSGTGAGWQVVLEASDFLWDQRPAGGDDQYKSISRDGFLVDHGELGALVSGSTEGVAVFDSTNLSSPVALLGADREYGEDTFTLPLSFNLLVPANSRAGSFTSTLTLTLALAP